MIISAGNQETYPFALPIGVGLIESAINLTRVALFNKPEFILFIGSAGSYGDKNIFDIVESSSASNIELSFIQNQSYSVTENIISVNEPKNIINSSNYITTDINLAKKLNSLNIVAENMEFFSVMRVAKEFEIDVKGIFVITNYCDKDAHKQYTQNISKANQILIQYLKDKQIIKDIS